MKDAFAAEAAALGDDERISRILEVSAPDIVGTLRAYASELSDIISVKVARDSATGEAAQSSP